MKIDPTAVRDLFERMREAARTESTSTTRAPSSTGSADALRATDATNDLTAQVRLTAERVLRGELGNASEARGEVVEQILRHRWRDRVDAERLDEMVTQLKPSLIEDPEFSRQVDEMLILAAREVGS